jgi:hypothetical protein
MIEMKVFGLLSAFLLVSTVVSPMYFDSYHSTLVYEFYVQSPHLEPGNVLENIRCSPLRLGNGIQIVAIHATISSFPSIHVQIWLDIDGMSKFYHVNSGSLGTANSDLSGISVYVPAGSEIAMVYWSHNLGSNEGDFHASITIFYVNS